MLTAQARDLDIRGVALERRSVRETSAGELVAKLIGDVGVDHNGLLGAELRFDDDLEPASGYMDYIRDAQGRPMWVEAGGYAMPRAAAMSVSRSIWRSRRSRSRNSSVAWRTPTPPAARRRCGSDDGRSPCDGGSDTRCAGSFRSMANWQRRSNAVSAGGSLRHTPEDPGKEIHPRCPATGASRMSTSPVRLCFMWAEVLQREKVRPDEMFNTHNGLYKLPYGRRTLNDVTKRAEQTWLQVLINSSNIGMARASADELPRDARSGASLRLRKQDRHRAARRVGGNRYQSTQLVGLHADFRRDGPRGRRHAGSDGAGVFRLARDGELAGTLPVLTLRATDDRSPALSLRRQVIDAWIAPRAKPWSMCSTTWSA